MQPYLTRGEPHPWGDLDLVQDVTQAPGLEDTRAGQRHAGQAGNTAFEGLGCHSSSLHCELGLHPRETGPTLRGVRVKDETQSSLPRAKTQVLCAI